MKARSVLSRTYEYETDEPFSRRSLNAKVLRCTFQGTVRPHKPARVQSCVRERAT